MEKVKELLKLTTKNQVKWVILVGIIWIILAIMGITHMVNYVKAKAVFAKADNNQEIESVIDQENLVSTSNMSAEELKKLNEQEVKKAEEKQKEEEKKKSNKENTVNTSKPQTKPIQNKYYIKVNYGAQTVTIYTYDKNGKYTVPVKACVCSTGAATPTSGVYRISWKAVWGKLFGNVWGHYSCQIVGDILFHSVPYKQARNDTLVSAYYDRLGTKDSMGCIRLTTIDAKWIYDNCPSGTEVEFYSSSNPGPLGKPSAQKVSSAPGKLKNWDPTDPDSNNPWRTYKPEDKKPNNTTNSTNTQSNNIVNNTTNTQTNNTVNNTTTNTQNNNTVNNMTTNTQTNNTINNTTTNTQTNNMVNNETTNMQGNNTTVSGENNQTSSNSINSSSGNEQ